MRTKVKYRADLLLLLSLLLVIVLHPILDQGDARRLILKELVFAPVLLSTLWLAQIKRRLLPFILVLVGVGIVFVVGDEVWPSPTITAIRWGLVAAYFGVAVFGLFSYLATADSITQAHLYTATSIYLMLGLLWFALYRTVACVSHSPILSSNNESDVLYFSLVTLTTVGYGDIVPLHREVRMLAAMEAVTGVLYVAMTVGILVSRFRQNESG